MITENGGSPKTLKELHEVLELRRVNFFEVSSRRWDAGDGDVAIPSEDTVQMRVMQRVGRHGISVRGRIAVDTPQGQLVADAVAVFVLKDEYQHKYEELDLEEELLKQFAEKVGVPCVFPFLREAVYEGARKVGIKAPLLGTLWAENIQLKESDDLA
ncbi:MAG: hypothetical protein IRY84_15290 [Thermobispora bispora]|nr:hypothetical protein [Thermobispora bispora]